MKWFKLYVDVFFGVSFRLTDTDQMMTAISSGIHQVFGQSYLWNSPISENWDVDQLKKWQYTGFYRSTMNFNAMIVWRAIVSLYFERYCSWIASYDAWSTLMWCLLRLKTTPPYIQICSSRKPPLKYIDHFCQLNRWQSIPYNRDRIVIDANIPMI